MNHPIEKNISLFFEINKIRITFAVGITTITGYVLYSHGFETGMIYPTIGIFLLACGASVINHIQEREYDARMNRTMSRPLPSKRISLNHSIIIAASELLTGSVILYVFSGMVSLVLGWLALIWYNGVYTLLKRYTARAVIPGSLIGAIPPLVGWVSAGGNLFDVRAGMMALFFFIWQVPHFMLLALKFSDDYRSAGFPNLKNILSEYQIRKNVFIWILLTGLISILLPVFDVVSSFISGAGIIISSMVLVILFFRLLLRKIDDFQPVKYFKYINYYVLIMVILLCTDHFYY